MTWQTAAWIGTVLPPLPGLGRGGGVVQGLTPLAIDGGPFGAVIGFRYGLGRPCDRRFGPRFSKRALLTCSPTSCRYRSELDTHVPNCPARRREETQAAGKRGVSTGGGDYGARCHFERVRRLADEEPFEGADLLSAANRRERAASVAPIRLRRTSLRSE